MKKSDLSENIIQYTKELKLPGVRSIFKEEAIIAINTDLTYENYLLKLLEKEAELRISKRMQQRIRTANFPYKKYLDELKIEELPLDAKKKLKMLKNLDFVINGQNVILAGNPGTGKTHIGIGLGIKACLEGYSVLFTTIAHLITCQVPSYKSINSLTLHQKRYYIDLLKNGVSNETVSSSSKNNI